MYKEKVQEFIDNYSSDWKIIVIDTMNVDYTTPLTKKANIIKIITGDPDQDKQKLFSVLDELKNCVVIFDRIDIWCFDYKSQEYYDIFSDLSNYSKKNNLLIYT